MKTRSQKTHGPSSKRKAGEIISGEHLKPAVLDLAKKWETDGNASREMRTAETLRRKNASSRAQPEFGSIYLAMVEFARATNEPAANEVVALLEHYNLIADKGWRKRCREIEQEIYPAVSLLGPDSELGYETELALVTSRWIARLINNGWSDEEILAHMTPSAETLRRLGWDEACVSEQVREDREHYLRLKQLGLEGSSLTHAAAVTAIRCRVVALSFPAAIRRAENAWREWQKHYPALFRAGIPADKESFSPNRRAQRKHSKVE